MQRRRGPNNQAGAGNNNVTEGLSVKSFKTLSEARRAEISAVVKDINNSAGDSLASRIAVVHSPDFIKKATVGAPSLPTTSMQSDKMGPEVYSPLYQLANLNLPRDRVTMNAWNRIFYDTNPLVRNAINLHASYPISKINISSKSKKVQEFFMEMMEKIDLYSVVYGVALEFFKIGEAFPYAELDKDKGTWKRITIMNPDFIHVEKGSVGDLSFISLKPDAALKKLISSNDPRDYQQKSKIPQHIIDCVKKGQNIPLDDINISHLKLLSSPYDVRGTSMIVSIYKDLMLYDKIRESKIAQADGMINPMTHVKVGSGEAYRATQDDIESVRMALEEAQYDKDYKLVTHDGISIERIGYSGATMEVGTDIDHIVKNIHTGLMVPESLINQEGATYASSSVGLEVLRQRYDIFRNMIKKWLERKIFAPICEKQDFFEYIDGEKRLVVPVVDFNHMNLYDVDSYISSLSAYVTNKQVSMQTLYRSLNLSYEEERKRLKEEAIHTAIFEKERAIMSGMRMSDLLSLDPEKPIPEPAQTIQAQPGGGADDLDIPGMDLGGGAPPGLGMPPGDLMGAPDMGAMPPDAGAAAPPMGGE
jgi:hypothetical protein